MQLHLIHSQLREQFDAGCFRGSRPDHISDRRIRVRLERGVREGPCTENLMRGYVPAICLDERGGTASRKRAARDSAVSVSDTSWRMISATGRTCLMPPAV